jgi:amino acid permease
VRSHFLHLLLYGTLVAVFFAVLLRRRRTEQMRFGALLFVGMVGGALALAYLMFPFPR